MNRMRRSIIIVLVSMIAVPMFANPAFAANVPARKHATTSTAMVQATHPNLPLPKQQKPTTPVEIVSKRTANTSVFAQPDGTKQAQVYATPIHYSAQENGATVWKNIDSSLKKDTNGYANTANSFALHFPEKVASNPVSVINGDKSLSFQFVPDKNLTGLTLPNLFSASVKVDKNTIQYGNVVNGVDFAYAATSTGLKETLTLASPNTANTFAFDINSGNLNVQKQEDGSVIFTDPITKKTIFSIPQLVMWDTSGGKDSEQNVYSNDIVVDLKPIAGGVRFVITPSAAWLKDPSRAYPITIDPSVTVWLPDGDDNSDDTYVEQKFPKIKAWDQALLYVGRDVTSSPTINRKGIVRTIIPFPVPDLTDANIINATFYVGQKSCNGTQCGNTGVIAELTGNYNRTSRDITWNNQPAVLGEMGYTYGNGVGASGMYEMIVTNALKHWFEYGNPSGSRVGSLEFHFNSNDEGRSGYHVWKSRNASASTDQDEAHLVIDYRDYYANYDIDPIPNLLVNESFNNFDGFITNTGRNTWSASDTHLSYHIYDTSGHLLQRDGERTGLPRDVQPHGDTVHLNPNIKAPATPGDYIIKWDMVQEGVTWYSEQGVPTFDQSLHVDDNPEYGAQYNIPVVTGMLVDQESSFTVSVKNIGRNTWSASDTHLSYHIYDPSGNLITWDGERSLLPRDVAGLGDEIDFTAKIKAPANAGDYSIRWDLVREGVTWFSEKGVPTYNLPLHVDDYPLYAARYNVPTAPPATALANSTITIPMSVTNLSRQNWDVGVFQLGYHWIDSTGAIYIYDGTKQSFTTAVARRNGTGSIVLNVKAPLNAGAYTLKIDMVHNGSTWFSGAGVATADYPITITNPAYSSAVHLGSEKYYTKAGPVDLATGNLAYSSVDLTVPSNTGLLSIGRSYNSTTFDNQFNLDASGYIHNWVVNGPYRENDRATRLSKAFIPSETTVQPSPGTTSANNLWAYYSSADNALDIATALAQVGSVEAGFGNNATAYVHSYLYSPTKKTYTLKIGSADGVKIWVNGAVVLTKDVLRGLTLDSDTVSITLNSGWNRLLYKVAHASGQWALSSRVLNTDGTVPADVLVASGNQSSLITTATLGGGWRTSFDESLNVLDADNIFYQDGTGAVDIFTRNVDGTYKRPAGVAIDLVKNTDNTFTIFSKSGLKTNFTSTGLLANRIDLSGNKITYTRDTNGNVSTISDGGRSISLSYTNGRLDSISNQLGQTITYSYDMTTSPFRLKSVTDPLGGSYSYEYAPSGKMTKFIDKNGNPSTISYDLKNRVTQVKDATGNGGKIEYNDNKVKLTDPLNHVSNLSFDKNNLMIDFTNAKGYREIYGVDGNYNVVTATPDLPENEYYFYKYSNTYDGNDNLLVAKDPMDNTTTNEYAGNDLVKTIDPKGSTTINAYSTDGKRLVLSQTDANSHIDSFTYDSKGRKLTDTDSMGNVTKFSYTADGDVATTVSPKTETTTFAYDTIGRKIAEKSALGNSISYGYDPLGRLASLTDAGGLVSKYEYDKNSNKIKEIDPKGNFKKYEYDALNRQTKVTDEIGAAVAQSYDAGGNATNIVDAKGKTTTLAYDELGQVTKQTDATGTTATLEYDRNGNVAKAVDQKGTVVTQALDKAGKPVSITAPDGTTTLAYDKNSNLVASNTTGQTEAVTLAYDKKNNLTTLNSTVIGNESITYDKNDNPITSTVSTATISTAYDANAEINQISTKLTENGQTLTNKLVKDKEGKLTSVVKANGDVTNYVYDLSGRVTQVLNNYKAGATQEKITYAYDAASNIATMSDSLTGDSNYTYDARNQLLSENDVNYTYDVMGNRTSKKSATENLTYTYDEQGDGNRLLKVTNARKGMVDPIDTTFEYDMAGNITKKISQRDGTTQYFYDTDNYFIKAILPNGTTVEYAYDKLAKHRISRTETKLNASPSVIKYVYDGDKLVSETKPDGKIIRSYTWDEDENLLSVTIPDANGVLRTYYYLKNGHSDITGLTTSDGTKMVVYDYDAWGNVTTSQTIGVGPPFGDPDDSGSPATLDQMNPRLYAGYWYDRELGLYFMKARMYDATLGRFLSHDPIVSGDTALDANPYIYTANNPVNRIDPSGKGWRDTLNNAWNWTKQHQAVVIGVTAAVIVSAATLGVGAGPAMAFVAGAILGGAGATAGYLATNKGHATVAGAVKAGATGALIGGGGAAVITALGSAIIAGSSNAASAASSISAAAATASSSAAKYSVYISRAGDYVGRTGNLVARTAYWATRDRKITEVVGNLTYEESRGVEQALINRLGGPNGINLVNKINSISEHSPDYQRLVNLGEQILNSLK